MKQTVFMAIKIMMIIIIITTMIRVLIMIQIMIIPQTYFGHNQTSVIGENVVG